MNANDFAIERLGEDALLLRLGDRPDAVTNARVHALAGAIAARQPPWLREIVPAYASLALLLDADADDGENHDPQQDAVDWLHANAPALQSAGTEARPAQVFEIPVCYEPPYAPDLDALATHAGLSREAVVERHATGEYTVAMLGFAPGFPYLLGLDPGLAMPRMATPRTRVESGSVGIGGAQTGIYPLAGPGGWRIVGRTPLRLFDAARDSPSLLQPGARVRFIPIDAATFAHMAMA